MLLYHASCFDYYNQLLFKVTKYKVSYILPQHFEIHRKIIHCSAFFLTWKLIVFTQKNHNFNMFFIDFIYINFQ